MTVAVLQFGSATLFAGSPATGLANIIDANDVTAAALGAAASGTVISVALKDLVAPAGMTSINSLTLNLKWLFQLAGGGRLPDELATVYSRETAPGPWTQRWQGTFGTTLTLTNLVIPVTSLPALEVLLELFQPVGGGGTPPPPPELEV